MLDLSSGKNWERNYLQGSGSTSTYLDPSPSEKKKVDSRASLLGLLELREIFQDWSNLGRCSGRILPVLLVFEDGGRRGIVREYTEIEVLEAHYE